MAVDIVSIVAGLVILVIAADRLVLSAVRVAKVLDVSAIVIGAVVVGFGTSVPEFVVSAIAASDGNLELAMSNVVASNIANVTLVLGVAALMALITTKTAVIRREGLLMLGSVTLLAGFLLTGSVGRIGAAVLLAAMAAALLVLLWWSKGTDAAADLESIDLYLVDWGLRKVVHTMISFGFGDGDYVCISIETRKEKGESYSTTKGFFPQYELAYIVADERDLVRLRTNYRESDDVYLYRLTPQSDAVVRAVFLAYVREINRLRERPRWYNALTSNCMTSAYCHFRRYAPKARMHWKIILNGYADELLYGDGALDRSLPFDELRRRSLVNEAARAAGDSPNFSTLIREGLPGIE